MGFHNVCPALPKKKSALDKNKFFSWIIRKKEKKRKSQLPDSETWSDDPNYSMD